MTGWVKEDDWGTVKTGDRVRLERDNGDIAEFTVHRREAGRLYSTTNCYSGLYWTLYVEARPVPALPTEPGLYADSRGFPWGLNHAGKWSDFEGGKYADRLGYVDNPTIFGPFTRLEPVPVTAKKVLEALEEQAIHTVATRDEDHRSIYDSIWDEVARQFGVTND